MLKKTIWVNCVVFNEENFIWFAIMSVVDFVDKVLVWDTGSTDKTVEIIREIVKVKGDKVDFRQIGKVDKFQFPKVRQRMLDESDCDWILILDGDEIWWEDSIKKIIKEISIEGNNIEGIVVPMIVPVGDIFHFQEQQAGQYKLIGRKGHFSLRVINKNIPNLHVEFPYGKEGYFDKDGNEIQKRKEIVFLDAPYLHVTHLPRSAEIRNDNKVKLEMGKLPSKGFKYPEILTTSYSIIVPNPWKKLSGIKLVLARIITPFKKIKRGSL